MGCLMQGGQWVLKGKTHQGKEVEIVSSERVLQRAIMLENGRQKYVLAQRLIENQLRVNKRPFYIR